MKSRTKKANSNKVRLDSLNKRIQSDRNAKDIIKQALSNIDSKSSKHVTFDSDSDENNGDVKGIQLASTKSLKQKKLSGNVLGFDESDDEGIEIKPQFEGEFGEELLHIQARVGADERFKIDERFAEDGNEENDPINDEDLFRPQSPKNELKQNLSILQQVVGTSAYSKTLKRKAVKFENLDAKRYDPTKEGHHLLEVKATSEKTETRKKKKKRQKADVETFQTDSTRFYEISSKMLKDAFGKPMSADNLENPTENDKSKKDVLKETATTSTEEPFSILKMMGRDPEMDLSDDEDDCENFQDSAKPQSRSNLEKEFSSRVFTHDSSDSEMEAYAQDTDDEQDVKETGKAEPTKANRPSTFFMLSDKDPRITDGAKLFFCSKTQDQIRLEWENCKDKLKEDYKKKHRNASSLIRRSRPVKNANGDH